ncbi:hypothetical protein SAMN05518871_11358 [Psychrobacillus sp. OK028]|uniref:hypothetical protein n=1 Tax=Psychrobacillus sp. OK028 TaxID=1884359 RepID=UPI00088DB9F0|nr:hypothetical protein [Psychrobacillus sp. OK028]SDO25728.1 hypothetical protein SAMN05518871_11358 [Psychrobacillus sp. OK028]
MIYQLYFCIPSQYEEIDYWVPLMNYFLSQSDTIEIHCWNEEEVVVEETKSMLKGSFEIIMKNNITIFKGKKALDVVKHLLSNNVNIEGKIKWFSIFLSKNSNTIFHSEHWGMEFFAPNVNEKDIAFIKSVVPTETNFNQYK